MQVNVSARHGQLKSEDQTIIVEKVQKLRRFYDRVSAIDVVVDFGRQDHAQVEVNVSAEEADNFVASVEANTVISALEAAIHKVEQQLRKHKEKVTGHRGTGLKHLEPSSEEEAS